ncbi:rubredoxin [Azoarcus olearius]|uniref:Rubredoxin n=1 Tax=Azoarcus sp. (strain BH72) TaxID=418699 RepID=A1KC56_AZOSB|nr:rubredoxin [Azoarcus olearius]ANQ86964.1 rubredoxin protein [Azoarcus olearius]CAL96412.1 probable rubredoxin protein [Azoarcus olearius]
MFEGSYLGNDARLDPAARLECGICWWVYDPAEGDALAQVPAGTPFAALPAHWCCPNCEAPRHKFMVIADD